MSLIRSVTHSSADTLELLQSISRNLILIVGGVYIVWHFIATLTWPEVFSPSLWISSALMLIIVISALNLVEKHYFLAQVVWLGGIIFVIFQAFVYYQQPEILIILVFMPLMAIITVGYSD